MNVGRRSNVRFRRVTYPTVPQNAYYISEYGDLYNSISNNIISGSIGTHGYRQYNIKGVIVLAHRLVAWEFVDTNRNLTLTVDHIDCNKLNNYYQNLEWVSLQENIRREYDYISHKGDSYSTRLIHDICKLYEEYNYSPIDAYHIIMGTDSSPRGNKYTEAFYRLLVSIRKKETHIDICNMYDYDPNESLEIRKSTSNTLLSKDQIRLVATLYIQGKRQNEILNILNISNTDPRFNAMYYLVFRICHRQSWTHLTDDIFNNAESIERPKSTYNSNSRFTDDQLHYICKRLARNDHPHQILNDMGYNKKDPDYKKYYEVVNRMLNCKYHTDISSQYFTPRKLAKRTDYHLDNELILAMITHEYGIKDICEVYGLGSKVENLNLYRAIMHQITKFRRLGEKSEWTYDELQDIMINEWAANW